MTDKRVREIMEQTSNALSRREFVATGIKGLFATFASLALGQLTAQPAFASHLYCCTATSVKCTGGGGCPTSGGSYCPTAAGWYVCTIYWCSSYCDYASGYWTCTQPAGTEYRCTDCRKSTCSSGGNAVVGPCTCARRLGGPSPEPP